MRTKKPKSKGLYVTTYKILAKMETEMNVMCNLSDLVKEKDIKKDTEIGAVSLKVQRRKYFLPFLLLLTLYLTRHYSPPAFS